jgi:hypothetical protein
MAIRGRREESSGPARPNRLVALMRGRLATRFATRFAGIAGYHAARAGIDPAVFARHGNTLDDQTGPCGMSLDLRRVFRAVTSRADTQAAKR